MISMSDKHASLMLHCCVTHDHNDKSQNALHPLTPHLCMIGIPDSIIGSSFCGLSESLQNHPKKGC